MGENENGERLPSRLEALFRGGRDLRSALQTGERQ
jgi:hypothetical protein